MERLSWRILRVYLSGVNVVSVRIRFGQNLCPRCSLIAWRIVKEEKKERSDSLLSCEQPLPCIKRFFVPYTKLRDIALHSFLWQTSVSYHLLWRLMHIKIPTNNKRKEIWIVLQSIYIYIYIYIVVAFVKETVQHIFMHCPFASNLRTRVSKAFEVELDCSGDLKLMMKKTLVVPLSS